MINLYAALGLERTATDLDIRQACRDLQYDEAEVAREAQSVLLSDERRRIYDQLHQQFIAIAHVEERLNAPSTTNAANNDRQPDFSDTNHWSRRLVEFK